MNYEPIRDQIKKMLKEVQGIGEVYDHPRHTTDWPSFLERFAVPHPDDASRKLICVCWFTRPKALEMDQKTGDRDEANVLTGVHREENWTITLVVGFQDDETHPSEYLFQLLVDRIQERFRWAEQIEIPATVHMSYPLDLLNAGLAMFGEVLCHKAEFSLLLVQRDDTP